MNKKAELSQEGFVSTFIWIVFFAIALAGVVFLYKRLTGA